jgi:hypothetical protein
MYRDSTKNGPIFPKLSTFEFFRISCYVTQSSKDRNLHVSPGTFSQGASSPYERNQETTLRRLAMAKIIPFYIPEGFKPPVRWNMQTEPKVLKFRFEEIKKSA